MRSFRRRPAFFAVSTVTLGIALAFATTILSVVEIVQHPPMPFDDPDRTFEVDYWGGGDRVHPGASRDEMFAAIGEVPAFDAITHVKGYMGGRAAYVGDRPVFGRFEGSVVSVPRNFFRVVGVRPRLGRTFQDDDAARGNSVIVSDDVWKKFFQDRPSIGKANITVDDQVYTIIGVMPAGMHEPEAMTAGIWLPLVPGDTGYWWSPEVHLRARATRAAAEAQLAVLATRLTADYKVGESRKYGFALHPLRREAKSLGGFYLALCGIALCILAIASANITTLMLARAIARRRDLALRLSLGASTRALVFDQLAESVVLAIGGGIAGVVLALWGIGAVSHFVGSDLGWLTQITPHWSWKFFAISLIAAGAVALFTGSLPAWQVARIQPMEPLKESSGGTTSRGGVRNVQILVAGELALSLALLVATALFARSTLRLGDFQFGFNASRMLAVRGDLVYKWNAEKLGTENPSSRMLPRVAAMDGVESASSLAVGHPDRSQVFSDRTVGIAPLLAEDYFIAGPGFMHTMGIPIIAGRDFEAGDDVRGAVILDERAVRVLFPDGKALGHTVRLGADDGAAPWVQVIGVTRAADLSLPKYLDEGPRWPPIYASNGAHNTRKWEVVARVSGSAPAAAVKIQRALNSVLPAGIAEADAIPFAADYDGLMRNDLSKMRVFLSVGIASLALAAAGLFAVMSYMVNQRMREYAVRVAIGARSGHLWRLVLRDGTEMALAGTAIGAFGGFFAGTLFQGGLYGVNPTDVISLVAAEFVLLAVALGACTIPALRATRADPVEILRAS